MNQQRAALLIAAILLLPAAIQADNLCEQQFNKTFDETKTSTPPNGSAYEQTTVDIKAAFSKEITATDISAELIDAAGSAVGIVQQPSTGDSKNYSFSPTASRIPDGTYYMSVSGTDGFITRSSCVEFQVNAPQMDLWIAEPDPTPQDKPTFAYDNDSTVNFTLQTGRDATCRLAPHGIYDLTILNETYEEMGPGNQFPTSQAQLHPHSVEIEEEGDEKEYDVICEETVADNEEYAYEKFTFGYEATNPEITFSASPSYLTNQFNTEVNLTVESDDQAVCEIQDSDDLLEDITPKPWENITEESYRETHELGADVPFSGNTTLTAVCTNKAGLTTTANQTVTADYDTDTELQFVDPATSITNNAETPVTVSDARQGLDCSATVADTTSDMTALGLQGDRYHYTTNMTLAEGENNISVTCTYPQQELTAETTITYDNTPPESPTITTSEYTCSTTQASFDVTHNQTDQDITLEYTVMNDDNQSIVYDQGQRATHDWDVTADLPDLDNNTTILVQVAALDLAGNNNTAAKQLQVTDQAAAVCDQQPPEVTLSPEQTNSTQKKTYSVTCTDNRKCENTYRYGITDYEGPCVYGETNNLNSSVAIQQNGLLCVAVYDENENNDTTRTEVDFNSPPHCFNGELDPNVEVGVDCGYETQCGLCGEGKQCESNSDCHEELTCTDAGVCEQPADHCSNDEHDEDLGEEGVDCGGPCERCDENSDPGNNSNSTCSIDADCVSNNCQDGTCQPATCSDGVRNQREEATDCGGPCDACPVEPGKECNSDEQCQGKQFKCEERNGVKQCVETPPECTNNETDGRETDVDCGGAFCTSCETGDSCDRNTDCVSGICSNNTCTEPSCDDGMENNGESDIDCGAVCGTTGLCPIGDTCDTDDDCQSGNCNDKTNICEEASCTNNKLDGEETDEDCGGPQCVEQGYKCKNGDSCERDKDCVTGHCADDGTCKIPPGKDSDNDGLPDQWEQKHGSSRTSLDPLKDPDDDGFSNLEEYKAGTNPMDGSDFPSQPKSNTTAYILFATGALFIIGGAGLIYYDKEMSATTQSRTPLNDNPSFTTDAPRQPQQHVSSGAEQQQRKQDNQTTMDRLEKERDQVLEAFDTDTLSDEDGAQQPTSDTGETPKHTPDQTPSPQQPERPDHHTDDGFKDISDESNDEEETSVDDNDDPFNELDDLT